MYGACAWCECCSHLEPVVLRNPAAGGWEWLCAVCMLLVAVERDFPVWCLVPKSSVAWNCSGRLARWQAAS